MSGHADPPAANRAAAATIVLAVLLSQGLVLFNGSGFWDGVIVTYAHESGAYDALFALSRQTGVPLTYLVHRPFGLFGSSAVVAYRVVYLATAALSAYLLFRLLSAARVPRAVALLAAVYASVLPLMPIAFEISLLPAHLLVACFLGGILLLVRSIGPGFRSPYQRLMAHALLVLSFFYGTCLFLALVASVFLLARAMVDREAGRTDVLRVGPGVDFLVVPWIFLGLRSLFFQPFGRYQGYNAVGPLDGTQIANLLAAPLAVVGRVVDALFRSSPSEALQAPPRLILATLGLALGLAALGRRWPWLAGVVGEVRRWPASARLRFGAASLLLLYLSVLPYFLVGRRRLYFEGYLSRDHMVSVLATACLTIALLCGLPWLPKATLAVAAAVALKLVVVQARSTLAWLDEDATLTLMREALRGEARVKEAQLVVFVDHATRFDHLEWLEFQHLLRSAYGDQSRLALPPFELSRCASVASCFREFRLPPADPLSALAGARDAPACGRVVRVEIDRVPTGDRLLWPSYASALRRGQSPSRLAAEWIRLRSDWLAPIACAGSELPAGAGSGL